jgi:heme-degrading monooxygenase HmoA
MIVRQVSFKVSIDRQVEFVSFWKNEYREAMSRQPGFIAARLLKSTESDDDLQMTLEFASEEHAADWRASPEHKRLGPRLKEYAPALTVKVLVPVA